METERLDRKVLLVEDEKLELILLKRLLGFHISTCLTAANGLEALDQLATNRDICMIVTDISMPEMDGIEMKQRLDDLQSSIPVVALTGHSEPELLEELKRNRFHTVFVKPIDRDKLASIVAIARESGCA